MTANPLKALTVSYREGERIIAAGEIGSCLFVIQSGRVRLSRPAQSGNGTVELAFLDKGDVFGEGALLPGRPYGTDADAASDCDVMELGPATFEKMIRNHPEIGVRVLRQLAGRLDMLQQKVAGQESPIPFAVPSAPPPTDKKRVEARLVSEEGGTVFPLSGTEVLLGRYDPLTEIQPEIDLSPVDTKRSVSRRHARLTDKDGSWYLSEEPGVLNGTFVNGVRLDPGQRVPLREGDLVSLGMVRLVYREG